MVSMINKIKEPSNRTTIGISKFKVLAALIIPSAITSHLIIPPKILINIALTFLQN